VRAIEKL
jgi:hypothetical protein